MTEAFTALSKEKQTAILHAAAAEFAEHGYKQASTNRIVQAAGIGKGMLFYYFGSKLDLYHDLLDRTCEMIQQYSDRLLASSEGIGIIEVILHATRVKMEAYLENPALFDFLARIYLHPEEANVSERTRTVFQQFFESREHIFLGELLAKADQSKLRRDIPPERLMQYIGFTMAGYTQHLTDRVKAEPVKLASELDWKPWLDELDAIAKDLKILFYSES